MLKFNANNVEELEAEARERAHEVSVNVVTCVIKALEADVDKIIIGVMVTVDLDLSVERSGYLEALQTNLVRCEEAEEYELWKSKGWGDDSNPAAFPTVAKYYDSVPLFYPALSNETQTSATGSTT